MHNKNVAFRVLVTAVLALGGFVFFPLFFVAALVGWALFKDLIGPEQPEPNEWFTRRWTVTAEDPDWKSCFLPFCESPAEEAFLEAMIADYALAPSKGELSASGLKMTLQAELTPYRVDFLVNDWLVIEIDGAAYHSSPEAVARDQARDLDLQDRGFRVLRVPAKTAIGSPSEAVRSVRRALGLGKPVKPAVAKSKNSPGARSLGQMLTSIDNLVTNLNLQVAKSSAVQAAMKQSLATFSEEKCAIDSALEIAVCQKETQAYRANSSEHAERYDEAYAELAALFDDNKPIVQKTLSPISAPAPHQNPDLDAAIKHAHQNLLSERAEYFEGVRRRVTGDRQLGTLVKKALEEIGYPDCWPLISG